MMNCVIMNASKRPLELHPNRCLMACNLVEKTPNSLHHYSNSTLYPTILISRFHYKLLILCVDVSDIISLIN